MSILRTLTIAFFAVASVACTEDAINGNDGAVGAAGADGADGKDLINTPTMFENKSLELIKE